jgi:hypothetical protein
MRKFAIAVLASVMLLIAGNVSAKNRVYRGEIWDNMCAAAGSHAAMLKMAGMGNMDPNSLKAKAMCTKECLKKGGKYVLYNPATKKTYQLDDQSTPEAFAGQQVRVIGTLDKVSDTIHVSKIEAGT